MNLLQLSRRGQREREREEQTRPREGNASLLSRRRDTHRAPRHCTPPSFGGETTGKALREERHSSRISIYTRNHRGGDRKREGERERDRNVSGEEHGTISSSEWRGWSLLRDPTLSNLYTCDWQGSTVGRTNLPDEKSMGLKNQFEKIITELKRTRSFVVELQLICARRNVTIILARTSTVYTTRRYSIAKEESSGCPSSGQRRGRRGERSNRDR